MSDQPDTSPVFPYTVEIDGAQYEVLDPEGEPGYRVRLPDGQVTAFPAQSGDPGPANVAADIAYALANPPAPPVAVRRQETRTILDRLTTDEQAALLLSDNPDVRLLIAKATATGAIRDDDPDFAGAVAGLDALGIIDADRWADLMA
jgi:hypothetical protein